MRVPLRLAAALVAIGAAWAQPADWRRVGPTSYEAGLASPAGGPVARVWFSPSGSTLYARIPAGKTFQTADFETWTPVEAAPPAEPQAVEVARLPEPGARPVGLHNGAETFALQRQNLYRSRDGGRSWENLTAFRSQSVIGGAQRSVAVSPTDPEQLVVANDFGVWRSMDNGRTWSGLNDGLPNLQVWRILSTPAGSTGVRVQLAGNGVALEMPPGSADWVAQPGDPSDEEKGIAAAFAAKVGPVGATVSAAARAGRMLYVGTTDGRFWYSNNGGESFIVSGLPVGLSGRVEKIYADPAMPDAAVAALSGSGPRIVRTFNGGVFWDSMDSGLPTGSAFSVAADVSAGAVYLAMESGVYWAMVDMRAAAAAPHWTSLGDGLPQSPVMDLKLDPSGVQLYVASAGYGVFATAAPHRRRSVRLVNAGDFSTRSAAPGSLLSVVGARVTSASASGLDYPVLGIPTDSESQIQVPFGASGPLVSLALDTATGRLVMPLQVQAVSPAIFVSREGSPMLLDADSGMPVDGRTPAKSGSRIQVFATGLGRVQPDLPAGAPAPLKDPPTVVAPVQAYLNGSPLQVQHATLAPGNVGWYVVEAQLPLVANFGEADLYISAGGQDSNHVRVVIEP